LRQHRRERQKEDDAVAELFDERAANEISERIGRRPSDVVDADGARGDRAFADERLERGPDETHADVHDTGSNNLAGDGTQL